MFRILDNGHNPEPRNIKLRGNETLLHFLNDEYCNMGKEIPCTTLFMSLCPCTAKCSHLLHYAMSTYICKLSTLCSKCITNENLYYIKIGTGNELLSEILKLMQYSPHRL